MQDQQNYDTSLIANSSSTPANRWELHSSWAHHLNMISNIPWNISHNHTSNTSCEDDISFTNAGSNQSGLTAVDSPHELVESSTTADLLGEPAADSHLWNQVLLTIGSNYKDARSGHDICETFHSSLSSKSMVNSDNMFEPSIDYFKKVGNTWEDQTSSNSNFTNNMDKQLNQEQFDHEHSTRLSNLPDRVRNWSIAPPEPYLDRHVAANTYNITSNNSSMDRYLECGVAPTNPNYLPYCYSVKAGGISYDDQSSLIKHENDQNDFGYNIGLKNSALGLEQRKFYGISDQLASMPSNARSFTDLITFGGGMKPSNNLLAHVKAGHQIAQDGKKLAIPNVLPTKGNTRDQSGARSEGRKRKLEDNSSSSSFKKPKSEGCSSANSSPKTQLPKAKVADRITVLQQIVSPFGKTDTASVLYEAIAYIKFLHEQVQLLSNPYLKTGVNKDHCAWGVMERKECLENRFDLKSRGLCLVPVACTPQVYRDNSGPDYLTPTYRGCLYR